MGLNQVTLVGRLTKDIELKYTNNGTAVTRFSLAVNRNYKNKQGEYDADFIVCQAWSKTAEFLSNHSSKGGRLGVVGRIQTRNYEDQNGNRVYVTEVVTDQVDMIDWADDKKTTGNKEANRHNPQPNTDDPFQNDTIDIDDNDLPF